MKRTSLLVLSLLATTSCQLIKINGKPLGGGSSPTGGGASSAAADPGASGGGGGPAQDVQVGTLRPGKPPPWCPPGYQRMENDQNARFAGDGGRYDRGTLRNIGRAACDKPGDPERERQLVAWREGFKKVHLASDQDFVNAITLTFEDSRFEELRDAQCGPLQNPAFAQTGAEETPEQAATRMVTAYAFSCADGTRDALYELDTERTTALQSVALVAACLPSNEGRTDGEFALCLHDLRDVDKLDRARFDAEVNALEPNLYGRVMSVMRFAEIKKKVAAQLALYKELAKDEAWQGLLAAHDAGWKRWVAQTKGAAESRAAVAAFQAKLQRGSKKALEGCSPPLFDLFFKHLARAKVDSKDELVAAATDDIGYPLTVALMHCSAAEGDQFARALEEYVLSKGARPTHRGPRYAAFHATSAALAAVLGDQEGFKLKRLEPYPETDRARKLASWAAYKVNDGSFSGDKGEIAKVTPVGSMVKVDFKTVRWREKTYACVNTRRIYRINPDGTLEYFQNCKVTGSEAKESTMPSVLVHAGWARGLKPGQLVDMLSRPRDGKTYGFPLEIYANAKATTPIGFMGVVWGK